MNILPLHVLYDIGIYMGTPWGYGIVARAFDLRLLSDDRVRERAKQELQAMALRYSEQHSFIVIDITCLPNGISKNPLKILSELSACKQLANILYHQHNFNVFALPFKGGHSIEWTIHSKKRPTPEQILENIEMEYEEDGRWFLDETTGDLVMFNNYYGSSTMHHKDANKLYWLEKVVFPGTFKWEVIHFPFQPNNRFVVHGHRLHRGTTMVIRFKKHNWETADAISLPKLRAKCASIKYERTSTEALYYTRMK